MGSRRQLSLSSPPNLAVGSEAALDFGAVDEGALEPAEQPEPNRCGEGTADAHHEPLPNGAPTQQRRVAGGEDKQQGHRRNSGAVDQSQDELGERLVAKDELALDMESEADSEEWENRNAKG